jgi:hypothetical protein
MVSFFLEQCVIRCIITQCYGLSINVWSGGTEKSFIRRISIEDEWSSEPLLPLWLWKLTAMSEWKWFGFDLSTTSLNLLKFISYRLRLNCGGVFFISIDEEILFPFFILLSCLPHFTSLLSSLVSFILPNRNIRYCYKWLSGLACV